MKRWERISELSYCGSCTHFVPHYVRLKNKQFFQTRCGHCVYHPEEVYYSGWTSPCKKYQPGYRPISLRLKRHAFRR